MGDLTDSKDGRIQQVALPWETLRPVPDSGGLGRSLQVARVRAPQETLSKNFVPGDGPLDSDIMVIGEAPGAEEDKALKPFVGRAGKLLNEALGIAGIPRETVYVTNVVKNRPPGNRTPTKDEIAWHITEHFVGEVRRVKPLYVLLLGNTALSAITSYDGGIWSRRGWIPRDANIFAGMAQVYATIHPSAALRNGDWKTTFIEDVCDFAEEYNRAHRKESEADRE